MAQITKFNARNGISVGEFGSVVDIVDSSGNATLRTLQLGDDTQVTDTKEYFNNYNEYWFNGTPNEVHWPNRLFQVSGNDVIISTSGAPYPSGVSMVTLAGGSPFTVGLSGSNGEAFYQFSIPAGVTIGATETILYTDDWSSLYSSLTGGGIFSSAVLVTPGSILVQATATAYNPFTLPTMDGSAGQIIQTDGNGNLSFVAAPASGIFNVVEDTSPELGGTLYTANNNILVGNGQRIDWMNTGLYVGSVSTNSSAFEIAATNGYDLNLLNSYGGYDVNIVATGGSVNIQNLTYPSLDGNSGQVLTTNGSGTLTWTNAGTMSNVVEDTSPQLGGDLDLNSRSVIGDLSLNYQGPSSLEQYIKFSGSGGDAVITAGATGNNSLQIAASSVSMNELDIGAGYVNLSGSNISLGFLNYPTSDGTAGQVLTTDGSGNLSFSGTLGPITATSFTTVSGNVEIGPSGIDFNGGNGGLADGFFSTEDSMRVYGNYYSYFGKVVKSSTWTDAIVIENSNNLTQDLITLNANTTIDAALTVTGPVTMEDTVTATSFVGYGDGLYVPLANLGIPNHDIITVSAETAVSAADSTASLRHILDNPNPYDTSSGDNFGYSVGISGNYAIVGAYRENDTGGLESGKAYIFNVTTGALLHTLDNPNAYGSSGSDKFGESVSISGNYAIVGARYEDDAGGDASGKAYIFNVTTGALLHTLNNPNAYGTSTGDYFGYSVSISGNYAIVGAYGEDESALTLWSGKAYIFDVTTGNLLHTLDNPNAYDTPTDDYFGRSVAISGNYALVGAYFEDDAGGSASGKAYIFDASNGNLLHTLDNPNAYNTTAFDRFGVSVSISGNYALVGAYVEDDAGGNGSGKAYIFDVSTGNLLHTLDNPNPYGTSSNDYFGESVSISDNYAIVGARYEDDAGGTQSGKSYIFDVSTGNLLHTLDNPNPYGTSAGDNFAYPVAISGDYAIVGAFAEDDAGGSASGKAYIFSVLSHSLEFGGTIEAKSFIGDGSQLTNVLQNVVDDTTPQLGGDLDLNGKTLTGKMILTGQNYVANDVNYHIELTEDDRSSYIANINGALVLSSGGYVYSTSLGGIRQMAGNSGINSNHSEIELSTDGAFRFRAGWNPNTSDRVTLSTPFTISKSGDITHFHESGLVGSIVFNEGGNDADFRVETDTDTHTLFIRGSDDHVGIGTSNPTAKLHVNGGFESRIDGNTVLFVDEFTNVGNVGIGTANPSYKLEVNGAFAATTKSFLIDHPTKEGYKLRYGSLEGPENGVYVRGRLQGTDTIELPDYWTELVDADTITVQLTANGAFQKLYVKEIKDNKVIIGNASWFSNKTDCFYVVYGERKDVAKLEVEFKA